MSEQKLNRRQFFERALVLGAAMTGAGAFLTACGSPKRGGGGEKKAGGEAKKPAAPAAPSCNDVSGLTDAEKKGRETFKYVEKSTLAGKNCTNCSLYKVGAPCGTCTIMKGPINPQGYCTAWAEKKA